MVGLHRQTPNTHLTGKVPACRLHPAFNRTFPSVVVAFKGKETSDEAVKRDEK